VPRLFIRLRRRFRPEPEAPASSLVAGRGLGEPPAAGAADDAELDALRGELVRELDRLASSSGSSAPSTR
jgi:hypothetical protein